jgi:hypothetical protein
MAFYCFLGLESLPIPKVVYGIVHRRLYPKAPTNHSHFALYPQPLRGGAWGGKKTMENVKTLCIPGNRVECLAGKGLKFIYDFLTFFCLG